jgi:hypothetical protein
MHGIMPGMIPGESGGKSMLHFYLGQIEPLVEFPAKAFASFDPESWVASDFGRRMINDLTGATVVSGRLIDDPILGAIPPADLAGGIKSTLMAVFCEDFTDYYYAGDKFGDNCYPWLVKGARVALHDIKIRVGRILRAPWEGDDPILMLPKKEVVKGYAECREYLAMHVNLFFKGEGYGKKPY